MKPIHRVSALLLVVLLAACGTPATSSQPAATFAPASNAAATTSPASDAATAGAPAAQTAATPVELTFWNTFVNTENAPFQRHLETVQQTLPGVALEVESIPHDQYKIKVKTQAAGQALPDLIQVWPGAELEPLVRGGVLLPIDDVVGEWRDTLIPPQNLQDYAIDGKQYAIPANTSYTHIIFYNKKLLADAGYAEFPATYDEFKTMIGALTSNGVTPIALGNKGKWVLQSCYISVIADRLTGPDFLNQVLVTKERSFTDPDFVQALGVIKELADLNAFNPDMNNIDNLQQRELLLQGKAAMMVEGTWAFSDLKDKLPAGFELGVAAFPAIAGGKGDPQALPGVTGMGIALNANLSSEKKAAAEQFLRSFYNPELYTSLLQAGVLVPAKVEVPSDVNPTFKEIVTLTSGGITPVYDAMLPAEATDAINNGLQAIVIGQATPEQVAQELQTIVDSQ